MAYSSPERARKEDLMSSLSHLRSNATVERQTGIFEA